MTNRLDEPGLFDDGTANSGPADAAARHGPGGLAASQLANHGVSGELAGFFTGLAEQTLSDGGLRFSASTVAALRRSILCRTHASLTLELGHLLTLLARGAPDDPSVALRLFYVDEAVTARRFCDQVAKGAVRLPEAAGLDGGHLNCGPDQGGFSHNLHRLPLWLALLELVVHIDPNVVTALSPSRNAEDWARSLQKLLQDYLVQHLQPANAQQRSYRALQWLGARAGEQPPLEAISDEQILQFWLQADPEDDFRRFRSVAEVFLYLYQALQLGSMQMAEGHSLALDEMEDWLTIDEALAEQLDDDALDGECLTRCPKFLTARVWRDCQLPVQHRAVLDRLPLTVLRMQVMGDHQARLIEAGKRSRAFDWAVLERDGYAQWTQCLQSHRAVFRQAALAGIEVLLRMNEPAEALSRLADWHPGALKDLSEREDAEGLPTDLDGQRLSALRLAAPSLNRALDACGSAFKSINRTGFQSEQDFVAADLYLGGLDRLRRVEQVLGRFLQRLEGAEVNYASDLAMYRDRFQILHGADS
ncbi:MAG: hypothetical protein U5L08_16450 [Xanthomonadales bacterium]|nr:hypothetical protein [Xanthomonadales bacterium]